MNTKIIGLVVLIFIFISTIYALTQCDEIWNSRSTICGVTDCQKQQNHIEVEWDGDVIANDYGPSVVANIYLPDQDRVYKKVNIHECPKNTIANCRYDKRDILNTIVVTKNERSMLLLIMVFIILIIALSINYYKLHG